MQQIVEKALKEDEKLRKKGIIPRLSTDIFDEPFDFDEIQSIVNEMETTNQNVKTESSETTTVKTEINDNSNETQQMTEPILIEDDVKLEEVTILIFFRLISILIFPGIQPIDAGVPFWSRKGTTAYVLLKNFTGMFRHRHGMRLINGLMTSQVMLKCPVVKKRSKWTRMMRTKMRKNQREM